MRLQMTDDVVTSKGLARSATHRVMADNKRWNWADQFRLLHFFATHPERVHSRSQLLIRSGAITCSSRTHRRCHIRRLRSALEPPATPN